MAYDRFKNITMQQMEALIRLVDERSFSRAAKKMYLTQPSLTKHIKNLEDSIDAQVVIRKNTGISLTREGKVMYDYARRIFKLVDEAKDRVGRVREDESGSIFISASTIPSTYILPYVLRAFNDRYRDIHCYVQMSDSEATVNMVLDGQAEIGFIGKLITNKKLNIDPVWQDKLILVVPDGHVWHKKDRITIEELSREPFIVRERGSATRATLEEYLRETAGSNLTDFNIISELGSSEAVKEAIIAGLGVSILSVHAVKRDLKQGLLIEIPLDDHTIERNFYVIYKKRFALLYHHKLFLDFVNNSKDDFPV
ncbi:MAG: LysR family transcriptional regulator [Deltaproteobacteria bacterium]|nr:LysR family transcriptional regulator [Deltaproteobacteria bacterium]